MLFRSPDAEFQALKQADLSILISPYLIIGIVVLTMFLIILLKKMPKNSDESNEIHFGRTLKRIFSIDNYRQGVVAQFFYVGAQIMCWTFIIQYGTRIFMAQGMQEQAAEVLSQKYNIFAMIIFCISRFINTYLLKSFNPGRLLRALAVVAGLLTIGVIAFQNIFGLYCLVAEIGRAHV